MDCVFVIDCAGDCRVACSRGTRSVVDRSIAFRVLPCKLRARMGRYRASGRIINSSRTVPCSLVLHVASIAFPDFSGECLIYANIAIAICIRLACPVRFTRLQIVSRFSCGRIFCMFLYSSAFSVSRDWPGTLLRGRLRYPIARASSYTVETSRSEQGRYVHGSSAVHATPCGHGIAALG